MAGAVGVFATILVAVQAPELLGRDVRYRVLSLYFSRALLRVGLRAGQAGGPERGGPGHPAPPAPRHPDGRGGAAHVRRASARSAARPGRWPAILGSAVVDRRGHGRRGARDRGVRRPPGLCDGGDLRRLHRARDHRRRDPRARARRRPRATSCCSTSGTVLDAANAWFFGVRPVGRGLAGRRACRSSLGLGRLDRHRARVERDPRPALPDDRRMSRREEAPLLGAGRRRHAAGRPVPRELTPGAAVELLGVSRWYGNVVAVNDISFVLGPRGDRAARAERGGQVDDPAHARRAAPAVRRRRRDPRAPRPGGTRPSTASMGLVPERESVHPFLTGFEFARLNARLQRLPDPDGAARRAIATVGLDRRRGPRGRHLLQGDAPAGQDRRRARPRPLDPAPRRAVQRDGSRASGSR